MPLKSQRSDRIAIVLEIIYCPSRFSIIVCKRDLLAPGVSYHSLDTFVNGRLEFVAMESLDPILDKLVFVPKRAVTANLDSVNTREIISHGLR